MTGFEEIGAFLAVCPAVGIAPAALDTIPLRHCGDLLFDWFSGHGLLLGLLLRGGSQ